MSENTRNEAAMLYSCLPDTAPVSEEIWPIVNGLVRLNSEDAAGVLAHALRRNEDEFDDPDDINGAWRFWLRRMKNAVPETVETWQKLLIRLLLADVDPSVLPDVELIPVKTAVTTTEGAVSVLLDPVLLDGTLALQKGVPIAILSSGFLVMPAIGADLTSETDLLQHIHLLPEDMLVNRLEMLKGLDLLPEIRERL